MYYSCILTDILLHVHIVDRTILCFKTATNIRLAHSFH